MNLNSFYNNPNCPGEARNKIGGKVKDCLTAVHSHSIIHWLIHSFNKQVLSSPSVLVSLLGAEDKVMQESDVETTSTNAIKAVRE